MIWTLVLRYTRCSILSNISLCFETVDLTKYKRFYRMKRIRICSAHVRSRRFFAYGGDILVFSSVTLFAGRIRVYTVDFPDAGGHMKMEGRVIAQNVKLRP